MSNGVRTDVLNMLSGIEIPPDAAEQIQAMGPEAVDVACEAALGTYAGLRQKVRTNAAFVVGEMRGDRQATETMVLLLTDANDDVRIRALRAAKRRKEPDLLARVALALVQPETSPIIVVEAIDALAAAPEEPTAHRALNEYRDSINARALPHRRNQLVEERIERLPR